MPPRSDPGTPVTTCTPPPPPADQSTCITSDAITDQGEATLDVELLNSVAPGATIGLIASADVGQNDGINIGIDYAIDTSPVPAHILSISFSSCESDNGSAVAHGLDQLFRNAQIAGIGVFVASGDGGVAGCEDLDSTPSSTQTVSINALCSSGMSPAGGTEFGDAANPSLLEQRATAAIFYPHSATFPKGAWNDPIDDKTSDTQFSASGGGVSSFIATPSWQVGTGVPGTQGRYTPDVSFPASTREGYFTCFAAQNGSCAVVSNSFSFIGAGGTSASTPIMAGVAASLNQKTGSAQANLNATLYALAANPSNGVFHDATIASSGVSGCTVSVESVQQLHAGANRAEWRPAGLSSRPRLRSRHRLGFDRYRKPACAVEWNRQPDQHGLTGTWYNPTTGGQGFLIETYPDLFGSGHGYLAMGWYTYDATASGGQRWYTLQGEALNNSASVPLKIYAATGGNFNAAPIISSVQVGTGTLSFSDCTDATLSYDFNDGRIGSISLVRLDPNITSATAGDNGEAASNFLLSGAWHNLGCTSRSGIFSSM